MPSFPHLSVCSRPTIITESPVWRIAAIFSPSSSLAPAPALYFVASGRGANFPPRYSPVFAIIQNFVIFTLPAFISSISAASFPVIMRDVEYWQLSHPSASIGSTVLSYESRSAIRSHRDSNRRHSDHDNLSACPWGHSSSSTWLGRRVGCWSSLGSVDLRA